MIQEKPHARNMEYLTEIAAVFVIAYVVYLLNAILYTLKHIRRIYASKNDVDIGDD